MWDPFQMAQYKWPYKWGLDPNHLEPSPAMILQGSAFHGITWSNFAAVFEGFCFFESHT